MAIALFSLSPKSTAGDSGAREPAGEWRLRGGNAEAQFFSPLNQINEANVKRLGLAWAVDLPSPDGVVGTPVVADGVVYLVGVLNIVYAYDLRSGKLLWTFDPKVQRFSRGVIPSFGVRTNRGAAIWQGSILVATGDCRLISIDAKTGSKIWDSRVCKEGDDYTLTAAPRIGADKVFVGATNEDFGTRRGYVDAYDARTGKRLWRFYTIPGDPNDTSKDPAMKMAARTWDPAYLPKATGGSAWEEKLYDPVTHLVYIGVGGPVWNPDIRGPKRGDELFTNSIVALNADTGAYVWHYQTTPGDAWNLEPVMPMILATLKIDGADRRVLMEAPKNGFFYVLDPQTGKLINEPKNFVPVNWAKRIDFKSGRPVVNPAAEYWKYPQGAVVSPPPEGSKNWMSMSYNPITGLVYFGAVYLPTFMQVGKDPNGVGGGLIINWFSNLKEGRAPLIAWDPVKQSARWEKEMPLPAGGGVVSTAGNLVFQGSGNGTLNAYRATDGAELWSFNARTPIVATPVPVEIDGKQMLIVPTGNLMSALGRIQPRLYSSEGLTDPPRLLAFQIDGGATLPAPSPPAAPFPRPPRERPTDAKLVASGKILFEANSCDFCHGISTHVERGSVPDLRRASGATHDAFEAIVRGGALQSAGMPSFADDISSEDLKAIEAFVLDQAWQAYLAPPRSY
jgi:quinohemoprotein ethanol dehydrogenase